MRHCSQVKQTMNICDIISAVLAFINTVLFVISNFRKTKKEIVFFHMCDCICDFVMYLILGAKTGLANATANLCKNAAYAVFDSESFMAFFAMLRIGLLVIGYEGIPTVLFIILEIAAIFILKKGSTQQFRILTAVRQAVWVVYDWHFANAAVACFTFIGFISCVIAVAKNRDEKSTDSV